jgi:hypothetical protein
VYAIDDPKEAFIDHFHTCSVQKNLHKINSLPNDAAIGTAIDKGYAYYRQELFDQSGLAKQ